MALPNLLLASSSPRRRQLLSLAGWAFTIATVEVDETPFPAEQPQPYTLRLAEAKARAVLSLAAAGTFILAADTTVADGEVLLGKPAGADEARQMLQRLHGRTHQVYTAIALLDPASGRLLTDLCCTQVPMREYSDDEMEAYIASGDPLDKAGAYAIQNSDFHPVTGFRGCFASVMGLPLCHLNRLLARFNVAPHQDAAQACQTSLHYECPIYPAVLRGEDAG